MILRKYLAIFISFVFIITIVEFDLTEVHGSSDPMIEITYNDKDGNDKEAILSEIGTVADLEYIWDDDEEDDIPVTLYGKAYLATIPAGSTITNINWASYGSNTLARIWYKTFPKVCTNANKAKEYIEDTNQYLSGSEFWDTSSTLYNSWLKTRISLNNELPLSSVQGFIFSVDNRSSKSDWVFIQISTGLNVDKSNLELLLNRFPEAGYYFNGDTWNGKVFSNTGFWNELQSLKSEVQAVYDSSSYTQDQIDAKVEEFTARLDTAISNLIPDTQVLPVKIHDALETYKPLSDDDKAKYSSKSVQKYENARSAAVAVYDTLFDSNGNAIVETNKAERQEEIDAVADVLEAAYNDLLGKSSEADIERWLAASEWVSSQTIVEDHFTPESVNALNTAIQTAKTIEDAYDDPYDILASKTEYQAYTDAVASALCAYYQLENAGPISVHVRIVDNYGITHPEYAIDDSGDSDMAHFNGDVTLTNNKTIQGLFLENEGGLYTTPKTAYKPKAGVAGIDDSCQHAHTYVYVNGKLAIPALQADPTSLARMNPSAGHMDVYSGEDLSAGPVYFDHVHENIEERFPVLKNALHDGDNVIILRTSAPFFHFSATGAIDRCISDTDNGAYLSAYYDSFGFLNIDDSEFTDGAIETKPGEGIEISVSQSQSDVITGDPDDAEEAKEISVLASEPFETKEAAEKASSFTALTAKDGDDTVDVVTDADGKAEFSLAKEGWYRIAVMGIKGELRVQQSYLVDGNSILPGYYPDFKVSDYMLVHITLDDERKDVADAKTAAETAKTVAETAKETYEESKEAADAAAATPGDEAVAAAAKALEDAETAAEKAEQAKDAADAYLAKVQALEAKKDQMSDANKAAIEAELLSAEKMAADAAAAKEAADAEVKKAEEAQDKAVTKADLEKCKAEIEALKTDIAEKQQEIEELNGQITTLTTENTNNKNRISELETEIAAAQEELQELLGDEENQGKIDELNSQIEAAQNTINELNDQISANQTEIDTLKGKVDAAQSAIDAISAADPLAEARTEAINTVNKYLEDNAASILEEDTDSAELAALKALLGIKDAKTAEEIKKAVDAAIAKIDEKIEKAAKIAEAEAQKVTGLKVKVKKTKATVTWKKNAKVTGYEVYRSLKKKSGYKKVATVKKNTKVKFVNKNLKKGKKYFYKVRTFTKINGKTYYGKYSAVKATKKIK